MSAENHYGKLLDQYLEQPDPALLNEIVAGGIEPFTPLLRRLRIDLTIDKTERLESVLKAVLKPIMNGRVSGDTARKIALFQKDLGFILKYKSYCVKAACTLGYSLFLQNRDEGFSFQNHITHKTEVFHILACEPGGYVFLCEAADWEKHYDEERFEQWMRGQPHEFFDAHKFVPQPGDVFVISELGIVHTVIGCVLEEFATVSTDMVQRLHDQNAGRKIPAHFTRENVEKRLPNYHLPSQNRLVSLMGHGFEVEPLETVIADGVKRTVLTDSFVLATRLEVDAGQSSGWVKDANRATYLRVFEGGGRIGVVDDSELIAQSVPHIPFKSGDQFMIPPDIHFELINDESGPLRFTEHRIAVDVAYI